MMTLERAIKPTLTPFMLDEGDTLRLTLSNGRVWTMMLRESTAAVSARGRPDYRDADAPHGDIAAYEFSALASINGRPVSLTREVGTQNSFYKPWTVDGVRLWFDASAAAFAGRGGFMEEKDWRLGLVCCPAKKTRWAAQEEGAPICPEPLHDWFPRPARPLKIRDCYMGEDCWMGPYNGAAAHCGLDVNMKTGTPLFAPFSLDRQRVFDSVAAGSGNNRWLGERLWPDGSLWQIQTHHVAEALAPANAPVRAGRAYALAAGAAYGAAPHTHFLWRVTDCGATYLLDPWILFSETRPADPARAAAPEKFVSAARALCYDAAPSEDGGR